MAVNSGAHVLPGHNGADLLLRWDVLPGSSLPQRVEGEGGVTIHLRTREELSSSLERTIWIGQCKRDYTKVRTSFISKHANTSSGGT